MSNYLMPPGAYTVKVNGEALNTSQSNYVEFVQVELNTDGMSMFELKLRAWDDSTQRIKWLTKSDPDYDLFSVGSEIAIYLGYVGDLKLMLEGYITGINFEGGGGPNYKMIVRGYDQSHRLTGSTNNEIHLNTSDSGIAEKIIKAVGLTANVVDSEVEHEHVTQYNQTDYDFLKKRAKRIGYIMTMMVVDDDDDSSDSSSEFYFGPRKYDDDGETEVSSDMDLTEFSFDFTTQNLPTQLVIHSYNPDTRDIIEGIAIANDITPMGLTFGLTESQDEFEESVETVVDPSVLDDAEAKLIAIAKLAVISLKYVTARATCYGRTDLKQNMVVKITGMGTTLDGNYYVAKATHTFSQDGGYMTSLVLSRNATDVPDTDTDTDTTAG